METWFSSSFLPKSTLQQPIELTAHREDAYREPQHDEGTRCGGTNLSKMTPGGQLQKSGGAAALPDGAEPERLNVKNSVQTTANGDDKVARVRHPTPPC